tara:strand:+ start:3156 stop:4115 length:960 start_codon:yes stop_codon:yes gene_type:complete
MNKPIASILLLACLCVAAFLIVDNRRVLMIHLIVLSGGESPALLAASEELASTRWHDDYFTIDEIAPATYAIGEPRYYQQNYSYLIVGKTKALLFDAGPGLRNIRKVAESLTDLPIIFLPSHFHYDHVGNGIEFDELAVIDLPYLRQRAQGNQLAFTDMEHLGAAEGFDTPQWQIDYWWRPGQLVELGGRTVQIIHTPGHSKESISILDAENHLVLSGDYLYPGMLYAFVPGSSMQDYASTADVLLAGVADLDYYGAHRVEPPGPPKLSRQDLLELKQALQKMRLGDLASEGIWPAEFKVNDNITILADPGFLQDWQVD